MPCDCRSRATEHNGLLSKQRPTFGEGAGNEDVVSFVLMCSHFEFVSTYLEFVLRTCSNVFSFCEPFLIL